MVCPYNVLLKKNKAVLNLLTCNDNQEILLDEEKSTVQNMYYDPTV